MKKLIVVLLGLGLVIAAFLFFFKKPISSEGPGGDAASFAALEPPRADQDALYSVKVTAKQTNAGPESILVDLDATLSQVQQSSDEYVSQWKEIKQLNLMGSAADQTMASVLINKPILSTRGGKEIAHFLPKDFPPGLTTFQLSFLQKIFVGVKPELSKPVLRTERDEVGNAKVKYVFEAVGKNYRVTKTWLQYTQDHIKVDAVDNQLVYGLGPDGRLLGVEGMITLHYRTPTVSHFTTFISVVLKDRKAKTSANARIAKEELKSTSMDQAVKEARKMQEQNGMSYEEALQKLDEMTDKTDSKIVYSVFSALKADVIENPDHADRLIAKILETKERDASARRRLSAMFGALAQSESPAIADSLSKLATDCPDNFCKVQAIVGLNDHPQPSEANAERMMAIANGTSDNEIASTALLAAGSIGKKLNLGELPAQLIQDLNEPSKAGIKPAVLAAMGNHGSADYYPTLLATIDGPDASLKSSAVYSLRYLPNEEVNGTLINVIQKDSDKAATQEAFKALQYRNLTDEQYVAVAQKSATYADQDLQQSAARMLVEAYYDNPKVARAALVALRDNTKLPDVKAYIDSELNAKPADPARP